MTSYSEALALHTTLQDAAKVSAPGAQAIWLATMGDGDPLPDSYVEAALDLAPIEYASALAHGGTANAFAVGCLWQHWYPQQTATPHERRELARDAWDKFCERAKLAGDVQYGLGCDSSMAWECTRDVNMRRGGMERVVRVAQLAGRMYAQLRRDKAQRVTAVPEEVYDIELGNNLSRLLPSELMHLGTPTEVLLLDNIASGKCLQYKLRGTDDVARGPLVIALDESGSMYATRQEWSKAAAVALTRTAWDDNRVVCILHYSTGVVPRVLKPGDTAGLIASIEHWLGGGTKIANALRNGARYVDKLQKKGDKGADVILVSDGEDYDADGQNKAIDRIQTHGARLWTVAIECSVSGPLKERAEYYIEVGHANLANGDVGEMKGAVL